MNNTISNINIPDGSDISQVINIPNEYIIAGFAVLILTLVMVFIICWRFTRNKRYSVDFISKVESSTLDLLNVCHKLEILLEKVKDFKHG